MLIKHTLKYVSDISLLNLSMYALHKVIKNSVNSKFRIPTSKNQYLLENKPKISSLERLPPKRPKN